MRTSHLCVLMMVIGSIFLASCRKDPDTGTPTPGTNPDPIQIGCLMVGQESAFIRFTGDQYFVSGNSNITYYADTLVMTVVSEDNGIYTLSESLTPNSVSVVNDLLPAADTTYFLRATVDQDTFWIEPLTGDYGISWFFGEVAKRNSNYSKYVVGGLPLIDFQGQEVAFLGWKTTHPYGEVYKEAHMVDQALLGTVYPFLNVLIDNAAMAYDGPGFTMIYEPKGRLVRTSVVNWWTQSGGGWDRL
ncbi:MAG: hypothetical protein H6568_08090 [Lewinellaceae bacterium]|nr:hypothetical protein [Saprospiraceae bacterium]MCB9312714.1 hypothetical protein [Lewinellaceae bacterium]HRW74387.1 hypothetical protein [Saprospiraceae bacterium]